MDQSIYLPSIWSTSPCSIPFANRVNSFQKSRRFQFNSIYYKDDPCKPKIQQDPLSRPQALLSQFRKKIKEATKSYHTISHSKKKKKSQDLQSDLYRSVNTRANEITKRLYVGPQKIVQLKYDLNGNRSSYFEDNNINEKQNSMKRSISPKELKLHKLQHKQSDNIYITSTPRTDFGKPLNFHPGPGSYQFPAKQPSRLLKQFFKPRRLQSQLFNTIDQKSIVIQPIEQKKNKLFASRLSKRVNQKR